MYRQRCYAVYLRKEGVIMKKDILEALLKLDCYCNKHICDECELCIDGVCFLGCTSPDEYHTIINSRNTTLHDLIQVCREHWAWREV